MRETTILRRPILEFENCNFILKDKWDTICLWMGELSFEQNAFNPFPADPTYREGGGGWILPTIY